MRKVRLRSAVGLSFVHSLSGQRRLNDLKTDHSLDAFNQRTTERGESHKGRKRELHGLIEGGVGGGDRFDVVPKK